MKLRAKANIKQNKNMARTRMYTAILTIKPLDFTPDDSIDPVKGIGSEFNSFSSKLYRVTPG